MWSSGLVRLLLLPATRCCAAVVVSLQFTLRIRMVYEFSSPVRPKLFFRMVCGKETLFFSQISRSGIESCSCQLPHTSKKRQRERVMARGERGIEGMKSVGGIEQGLMRLERKGVSRMRV